MSTHPIDKVTSALRRLDLSHNEQAIYLSLLTEGQATARTLAARTGITRPSVYDQLKTLQTLDLVIELEIENKAHFAAADIKKLQALLEDRIDRLEQSRDFLNDISPTLLASLQTVDPAVRFFQGSEGVKQLLKDIMWHDRITLSVLWPADSMQEVFDPTFLKWFDDRRQKRALGINSLWTKHTPRQTLFSASKDTKKFLPKALLPTMGYIIFANKVAFISSTAEACGFIVESAEFANLQQLQFDTLWQTAKSR